MDRSRFQGPSVREIAAALAARTEALCAELLAGGRKEGPEWRAGSVAGEAGSSLGVHLVGEKRGVWRDFAADQGGDLLDLIEAHFGWGKGQAVAWAKSWLGWTDGAPPAPIRPPRPVQRSDQARERQRRIENARALWGRCRPAPGTPVETYLRQARGIAITPPPSLRFHPALEHKPTGRYFPAMVAGIQDQAGQLVAVHRTYLAENGQGKAPVAEAKMSLGPRLGGAVRFCPPTPRLALAEGIETALSIMVAHEDLGVWACLAVDGLLSVKLPPVVEEILLCGDNDEPGSKAYETLERAGLRHRESGLRVTIARPATVKDFNDLLRHGAP